MHICFLSPESYGLKQGGMGLATLGLMRRARDLGHVVVSLAVVPPNTDPAIFHQSHAGIEVVPIVRDTRGFELHWGLGDAWRLETRLRTLHRDRPFDLLVAPDCCGPAFFVIRERLSGRAYADLPLVVVAHGPLADLKPFDATRPSDKDRLSFAMEDVVLRNADAILSPTAAMRRRLVARLGLDEEAITVVPNTLPHLPPAAWSPAGPPRAIVFAGRLERRKGVASLVEAFAGLKDDPRFDDVALHLYGVDRAHSESGEGFVAWAKRTFSPRVLEAVRFFGFRPHTEVMAALAGAAMAVFPSLFEPFGMAALEAMALGTPLVVSGPNRGIDEVVGEGNGLFYDPATGPQGLRPILARLLDDPGLGRDLSLRGRRRAVALARETATRFGPFLEAVAGRPVASPGTESTAAAEVLALYDRLARATYGGNRDEAGQPVEPRECILYLHTACDFRCPACARQAIGARTPRDVDLAVVRRVDALYPEIPSYCLAGMGEPTGNPELPDIARYLLGRGKWVGVITNGFHLEPLLALPEGQLHISISLYGASPQAYRRRTGVDAFDRVMTTYKALRPRFHVGFSFIVSRESRHELESILALCDVLEPAFLDLHNCHAYDPDSPQANAQTLTLADDAILEQVYRLTRDRPYVSSQPTPLDPEAPGFACRGYRDQLTVDGAGNIGGCPRRVLPGPAFGNLAAADPFNAAPMQAIRLGIASGNPPHPECRACFGRMPGGGSTRRGRAPAHRANRLLADTAACILFYEKPEQTIACVLSLIPSGVRVFILDNGSSEASRRQVAAFIAPFPRVRLLDAGRNLGVAAGRNRLLELVDAPWLLFLDNDITIATQDWPAVFAHLLAGHPDAEALCPTLFNVHEDRVVERLRLTVSEGEVALQVTDAPDSNLFLGGASLVRREVFKRLGPYDENMFVGFEDFELCLRGEYCRRPVKAVAAPDVRLCHDHKPMTSLEDRLSVLVRYDERVHEASFGQFAAKYPGLRFDHAWTPWVDAQVEAMLAPLEDRLALSTAARWRRSGPLAPPIACPPQTGREAQSLFQGHCAAMALAAGKLSPRNVVWLLAAPSPEASPPEIPDASSVRTVFVAGDPRCEPFYDGSDHQDMERLGEILADGAPCLFLLVGCLECLEDPRPLLGLVKKLLLLHGQSLALVRPGLAGAARQWSTAELALVLEAGGFDVTEDPADRSILALRLDRAAYERFLALHFLPPASTRTFVFSPEHPAAMTGGIGTYAAELAALAAPGSLGLCLYGEGAFLPRAAALRRNRLVVPERLLGRGGRHGLALEDLVLELAHQLLYLYPWLRVLECPDLDGPGMRLAQARRAGLLPRSLSVRITLHGPWPYLESRSGVTLGAEFWRVLEREKIAVAEADVVHAPTQSIAALCRQAGYLPTRGLLRMLPYPFRLPDPPKPAMAETADTLLFFGKRHPYKGFDLFTEAVRLLQKRCSTLRRIVLIGPRLDRMEAENDFFRNLGPDIVVEEHAPARGQAIALISANAHRAVCVLPYKNDNHPCSLLEVIGCRCPVVALRTGGVPEMLPPAFHGAVLAAPTAQGLAEAIATALKRPADARESLTEALRQAMAARQERINGAWLEVLADATGPAPQLAEQAPLPEMALAIECRLFAPESCRRLVEALAAQVHPPAEILCLAFGEEGGRSAAQVAEQLPNTRVVCLASDASLSDARATAAAMASASLLAMLPQGAIPARAYLRDFARIFAENPKAGAATCYAESKRNQLRPLGNGGLFLGLRENVFAHAASAFRKAALEASGEGIPDADGHEDAHQWAVCASLRSGGWDIGVAPRVNVAFDDLPEERGCHELEPGYGDRLRRRAAKAVHGLTPFDLSLLPGVIVRQEALEMEKQTLLGLLAERDSRLAVAEKLAIERFAAMRDMERTVVERDSRLAAAEKLAIERFEAMGDMERAVAERDACLVAAQNLARERLEAVQAMERAAAGRAPGLAAAQAISCHCPKLRIALDKSLRLVRTGVLPGLRRLVALVSGRGRG